MPERSSATELLQRWKSGDQAAADELHRRYAQRLCRLADRQLERRLIRRVDADDVVQSAFRTFFRRSTDGQFSVDHSGALWQLLARITLDKARREGVRHRAIKRDVAAEVYLDGHALSPEVVAHTPSTEEVVALLDELDALLEAALPAHAVMVRLSLEGCPVGMIAAQSGYSRFTVRRVLDRVGQRLRARLTR